MAIFHVHSLLLLLAYSILFFLPASSAIYFEYCNQIGYDYGNITRVDISPNPVGPDDKPRITIFGSASSAREVDVSMTSGDFLKTYVLCMVGKCSIEPGTNFVLDLSDDVPYNKGKEDEYKIAVTLIDILRLACQKKEYVSSSIYLLQLPHWSLLLSQVGRRRYVLKSLYMSSLATCICLCLSYK